MMDRGQVGILVLLALCGCAPTQLPAGDRLVLQHATVIDGTGAGPGDDVTIVIQGGRIESIESGNGGRSLVADRVIDLRGRWVVPGFIDMHAHLSSQFPEARIEILRTLLAFGITTIRTPAASSEAGVEMRDRVASGEVVGPRIFAAGPLMNVNPFERRVRSGLAVHVDTDADVREEVKRQAASGVDYIKVYRSLSSELVTAAIEEAHTHGIKVIGHLGETSWIEAAGAGIDGLVHSFPGMLPLRGEGSAELSRAEYERRWRSTLALQPGEMDALVSTLLDGRVEVNPTLVMTETTRFSDDSRVLERLEPSFAPKEMAAAWRAESHPYTRRLTAEDFKELQAGFPTILEIVRLFHQRGVLLTAGTDVGNPWITPGVSFHRELELLVRAGIDPLDVLSIATRNAAEALGVLDEVGTIEPGKIADLVVLRADPLASISDTRLIDLVIQRGEVLQPDTLIGN